METSDHVPYVVKINTSIPKRRVFWFENYWMEHPDFLNVVQHAWNIPVAVLDKAKIITTKFKKLRRVLKAWHSTLSNLKTSIANVKLVLSLVEIMEECRDLSLAEWNFKNALMNKLLSLLKQHRLYWKQRGTIKWVKFGDEGNKFFHANATQAWKKPYQLFNGCKRDSTL